MPLVRSIVHEAEHDNYRFSALVLGVVKSEAFQMNQKLQSSTPNGAGPRPVAQVPNLHVGRGSLE
jgi:hypothetical protein